MTDQPIDKVNEDGETASVLPANHTGPGAVMFDPLIKKNPIKRKLRDILGRDLKNDIRADTRIS